MKSQTCISITLIGALFTACGTSPSTKIGYTNVTISGGNPVDASTAARVSNFAATLLERAPFYPTGDMNAIKMAGGIMVYFQGVNGTDSAYGQYIRDENTPQSIQIKNGTYQAYSLGYTLAGAGGTLKCGYGNSGAPLVFDGTSKSVGFLLNNANCARFTTYHTGISESPIPTVVLNSCARVIPDAAGVSTPCLGFAVGNLTSITFQFRTYVRENNVTTYTSDTPGGAPSVGSPGYANLSLPNILSPCVALGAGTPAGTAPAAIFPTGIINPPFQMPLAIYGYAGTSDCTGPGGVYRFNSNLISGATSMTLPDGLTPTLKGDMISKISVPPNPEAVASINLYLRDFTTSP